MSKISAELQKEIDRALDDAESQDDAASIEFAWNREEKTWCLYGYTIGGLAWETDDCPAANRVKAMAEAAYYLREYDSR